MSRKKSLWHLYWGSNTDETDRVVKCPLTCRKKKKTEFKNTEIRVGLDWVYLLTTGLFLGVLPLYLFLSINILMTEAQQDSTVLPPPPQPPPLTPSPPPAFCL